MTFRVGQKVVCVDDSPTDRDGTTELALRQVYTIRWCGVWGWPGVYKDIVCVRLFEVLRGPDEWVPQCVDMPFAVRRFRPLIKTETDISVFTEILRKASKPARTPAMSQQDRA